jgi:hypothetical protein
MSIMTAHFQKLHLYVLAGFVVTFTALTFWAVLHMPPGDWNDWRGTHPYRTTFLAFSGPFSGAILRPFEPYCWKIAWGFFPYCAGFLVAGTLLQFFGVPFHRGAQALRITAWVLGLSVWFVGGFLCLLCSMQ